MDTNVIKDSLIARKCSIRLITLVVGAFVCIGAVNAGNCGSDESVDLQAQPSERVVTEDYDEERDNAARTISIDDYTYVASAGDECPVLDDLVYDGNSYLITEDNTKILEQAAADAETVDEADQGDCILRISFDGEWSYIRTQSGTEGYVPTQYLSDETVDSSEFVNTASEELSSGAAVSAKDDTEDAAGDAPDETADAGNYTETQCSLAMYAGCCINTRTGPGITYTRISTIPTGTLINIVAQTDNGWYKSDSGFYVKADLCQTMAPAATPAPTAAALPTETPAASETTAASADNQTESQSQAASEDPTAAATTTASETAPSETESAATTAVSGSDFASFVSGYIGVPYVYAGSSPSGFDCSGFVRYCYLTYYGITLPHSAHSQSQLGTAVSVSDICAGDIVCFDYNSDGRIDHSGIYIGNNTVIHASSSRGQVTSSSFSAMTCITTIRRVR